MKLSAEQLQKLADEINRDWINHSASVGESLAGGYILNVYDDKERVAIVFHSRDIQAAGDVLSQIKYMLNR